MRQTAIRSGIRCDRNAAVLNRTNREKRSGKCVAAPIPIAPPQSCANSVISRRSSPTMKSLEIRDVLRQPIRIVLRLIGESAADVIDRQHAKMRRERFDQVPKRKAPRRIAVHEEQRWARAFVEIVITQAVEPELVRLKGIFLLEAGAGGECQRSVAASRVRLSN